jgi:multidrug efflux pump subunit AcrA (membrane-fusion protein)
MGDRIGRIFVIGGVVLLLIVSVAVGARLFLTSNQSPSTPPLATVATRSFPVALTSTGYVAPQSTLAMNFPVSGTLAAIDVSVGQQVAPGTVLAKLSDSNALAAVSAAQVALQSAQQALNIADNPLTPSQQATDSAAVSSAQQVLQDTEASVQTTNTLDAQKVAQGQATVTQDQQQLSTNGCTTGSTTSVCTTDQAALAAAQAQLSADQATQQSDQSNGVLKVAQAQAAVNTAEATLRAASSPNPSQVQAAQSAVSSATQRLQAAQAALSSYTLVAPENATVEEVNGQVGQTVSSSPTATQSLPGTHDPLSSLGGLNVTGSSTSPSSGPLILLSTSSKLVVGTTLPANELGNVAVGDNAIITDPSLLNQPLPARVVAISSYPVTISGTSEYYVTLAPSSSSSALKPGQTVVAQIDISVIRNVLSVPVSSVYTLGAIPYVDVWVGTKAVPTRVQTGSQGSSYIQITSGLRSGQQVVVTASQNLAGVAPSAGTVP